jgi:hypothetical protein
MWLNAYVSRVGTEQPIGIVEQTFLDPDDGEPFAVVRWGVSDGHTTREEIPLEYLQKIDHEGIKNNIFEEKDDNSNGSGKSSAYPG